MTRANNKGRTAFCRHCGTYYKEGANFCPLCGRMPRKGKGLKCPSCGFDQIYESTEQCVRCGRNMRLCWLCQRDVPTAYVEFANIVGWIIGWSLREYKAYLCRACGEALYRQNQRSTLILGWWAMPNVLMNPFYILDNYLSYRKLRKLPL